MPPPSMLLLVFIHAGYTNVNGRPRTVLEVERTGDQGTKCTWRMLEQGISICPNVFIEILAYSRRVCPSAQR
jgi:hypothetical protein